MTVKHHRAGPAIKDIPGEDYCYTARSDTLGQPDYRIELEANGGTGECACKDFLCRCTINIRDGALDLHDRTCKHIRRALIYHALRDVQRRVEQEKERRFKIHHTYEFRNTGHA